ncbi:neuroendocrine convertase 1, partial [Kibdelosporangium lantanae]
MTYAGSTSPRTARFPIAIGHPTELRAFAYAGDPIAIPDNDQTGISIPFAVSGIGKASKVTFSVDGTDCSATEGSTTVGINHTYVGDLVGTLKAPSGATAVVFGNSGGSGNNMCKVVFDDTASKPFKGISADLAPYTGTWRPAEPFANLLGNADGTWTFTLKDTAGQD